jgi:hypothetical protein
LIGCQRDDADMRALDGSFDDDGLAPGRDSEAFGSQMPHLRDSIDDPGD